MSNKKSSTSWSGILSPILVILVAGSLSLAILDKDNRPAYFDMAKLAVGYAFGSMKLQENTRDSNNKNELEASED